MEPEAKAFDSVEEFVTAVWGSRDSYGRDEKSVGVYDAITARLEKLHMMARANIGQLVLVVRRSVEIHGCIMGLPAPLMWPRVNESFFLGILQEPGLMLGERDPDDALSVENCVALACAKHIVAWTDTSTPKIIDGQINDDILCSFWMCLDEELTGATLSFTLKPIKKLEAIAGDGSVYRWAVDNRQEELVQTMARLLDRELTFSTLTERRRKERDALALDIEKVWASSNMLARRIQAIQEAGKQGVGAISLDGFSLTVCETPDDTFWITLGDREKLQRESACLVRMIRRLMELGIDESMPNFFLVRHIQQQFGINI